MKSFLTLLSITLISTSAFAADVAEAPKATIEKTDSISEKVLAESSPIPELALNQEVKPQSNLWETLDTDKDGVINKTEATLSKSLFEQWDALDTNKDNQLDTEEFSQFLSQQN